MSTVGNVKIAHSERSYYYCYIHIPTFHIVWLLRNLSLGGKLCLHLYKFTIPCHCRRAWKSHATRAHRQEAVSDWLNPHSLGTMSAFGCIENLALSSTCLINYQDITISI